MEQLKCFICTLIAVTFCFNASTTNAAATRDVTLKDLMTALEHELEVEKELREIEKGMRP